MFVLFTDTDCNVSPEIAKKLNYELIYMPYTIEGKEYMPYLEGSDFTFTDFYNKLASGVMPSTSSVSPGQYKEYFTPFLKDGKDILYIHFSREMSGTFNSLQVAIDDLKEEFPNNNIYLIDTKAISIGSLSILTEASKLYKAGKTIEQITEWANKEIYHFSCYFFSEDLKFFQRSGRLSGLAATFGALFGVRPMIYMSKGGKLQVFNKAMGRKQAIDMLMDYVDKLQDSINDYPVFITHSNLIEVAEEIKDRIHQKYGDMKIEIYDLNRTIGSHTGPSTVGLSFHSKDR